MARLAFTENNKTKNKIKFSMLVILFIEIYSFKDLSLLLKLDCCLFVCLFVCPVCIKVLGE